MGVQVFHCLRLSEENSYIRLVDGFNAAQLLRQERPDLFDTLATTQIEHHYMERMNAVKDDHDDIEFFEDQTLEHQQNM